jgi:hypothetical protein
MTPQDVLFFWRSLIELFRSGEFWRLYWRAEMRKKVLLLGLVSPVGFSIWGDILFSRSIPFHGLLMIPVMIAAWQAGRIWGASLALALPLVHAGIILSHPPLAMTLPKLYTGTTLHVLTLLILSELIHRVVSQNRILKLRQEAAIPAPQSKNLPGMIPICSGCKDVRDDQGYWKSVENYIHDHSEVEFTHGICPGCVAKLYPEFAEKLGKNKPHAAGV